MKKLLVVAFALALAGSASAATLTETIDRTLAVRPGATVALTNVNGAITVKSWDQPQVRVVAVKEVKGDRDDAKEAMKELKVEIQQRDGGVSILARDPRRGGDWGILDWLTGDHVQTEVSFELTVPRSVNLDVTNTNGSIRVESVAGRHDLETTNGKIEIERCAGSIDAATTNGGIRAELVSVAKGQPLRFETTNGRIEVEVPKSFAGDIDAGTTNGAIRTDLPISTTRISRNSLRGTINGGGTPLRLRTTNGGIEIRTSGAS
jgi:Putative adhesin